MLVELFNIINALANAVDEYANEQENQESPVESTTIEKIDTDSENEKKSCVTVKYTSDIDDERHMYSYMSEMLDDEVFKARTVWSKTDVDITVTFVFKDREFHFKWNKDKDAFCGDFAGDNKEGWYFETKKEFFVKENGEYRSFPYNEETSECEEKVEEEPIDLELNDDTLCDNICTNTELKPKSDFDVLKFYAELNDLAKDNFEEIVPVMIDAIKKLLAHSSMFHFYYDDTRHDVNRVTFTLEDVASFIECPSETPVKNFYASLPNSLIINSIKTAFDFANVELQVDKETNQHVVICTLL